jgi:hypothetical protein
MTNKLYRQQGGARQVKDQSNTHHTINLALVSIKYTHIYLCFMFPQKI